MQLINLESFINEHLKIVDYLVNDVYNRNNRDDIRQDLLLFLCDLYSLLERKDVRPNNIRSYVFISLRNERNKLLNKDIYKQTIKLDNYLFDKIAFPETNHTIDEPYDFLMKNISSILSEILSDEEKNIINQYYYQQKTMKIIGDSLGITQQGVSKKISAIIKKIRKHLFNVYDNLQ